MDNLAISAGVASFNDHAYFEQTCQKVMASREWVTAELKTFGFNILPSAANFIFVTHPDYDAEKLALDLRQQGVIVRHFNHEKIKQFLRITIGTQEENQQLLSILDSLI
jgi:histidinol-phosphate aminotransferase